MNTLPTPTEIAERFGARVANDMFGFEVHEYLPYLPFDLAKPFLKASATAAEWTCETLTREGILAKMHEYMEFAWDKANDQRGLSAGRSVQHYTAWTWLAGDRELSDWTDDSKNYFHYGKPILQRICEHYGWDWKQWDDDVRNNGCDE